MLRILEIAGYVVVAVQLGMMLFGEMGRHLVTYAVLFVLLLVVEMLITNAAGYEFYSREHGASWAYVVSTFANAAICHQVTGRLYERKRGKNA